MKKLIYRYNWFNLFSFVSLLCMWDRRHIVLYQNNNFRSDDWLFPLKYFPPTSSFMCEIIFYVMVAAFAILLIIPKNFSYLFFILWLILISLLNPLGNIMNSTDGYLWSSLGMFVAFIINKNDSRLSFDYASVGCTYFYSASGLWKLLGLIKGKSIFSAASQMLPQQIAYGVAEIYREDGIMFLRFFQNHEMVSGLFWILIIFVQICVPLLMIFSKRWRFLGFSIFIVFHLMARWIIGPDFTPQVYLLTMMLCVSIYLEWFQENLKPD